MIEPGSNAGMAFSRPGRGYDSRAFAVLRVFLCLLFCVTAPWLRANNSSSSFEAMRVFVPEDQLRSIATRDHIPVDIGQLESALLELEGQRRKLLINQPFLQQATYVARLEDGVLISDASVWEFSGDGPKIDLGEIPFALKRARVDFDQNQLLDMARFSPGGSLEVGYDGETRQQWFGFSLQQSSQADGSFAFQMPVAAQAQMLIATPQSVTLTSDEVLIEPISNPRGVLPEDWPSPASLSMSVGLDRQWWVLHLSAVENFSLAVRDLPDTAQGLFRHVCSTGRSTYWIGPNGVEVSAKFDLLPVNRESSFKVRVSKGLQIREVLVDGQPMEWTPFASLSSNSNLIEIKGLTNSPTKNDFDPGPDPRLETAGNRPEDADRNPIIENSPSFQNADANNPQDLTPFRVVLRALQPGRISDERLPSLAIAESFTQRGMTRILSFGGQVIQDLEVGDCSVRSVPIEELDLDGPQPSIVDLSQLAWQVEWSGESPDIGLKLLNEESKLVARGLTSFVVNPDWLTATCRIRLQKQLIKSNSLRLKVGREWFVDGVRLIGEASSDAQVELAESTVEDLPQSEVVVSWLDQRSSIDYELEVIAHRPLGASREELGRVVSAPTNDQLDHFALQTLGRYQIQLAPSLLRYQKTSYELPSWQQELLPSDVQLWIFECQRTTDPIITLSASKGSFTGKLIAWPLDLTTTGGSARQFRRYTFQLQPEGGALEPVRIWLPPEMPAERCRWLQYTDGGQEVVVANTLNTSASGSLVELILDAQTTTAVWLGCFFDSKDSTSPDDLQLPIPQLDNAESWNTTVVMPADFGLVRPKGNDTQEAVVELLPGGIGNRSADLLRSAELLGVHLGRVDGLVTAKLDSTPPILELRSLQNDLMRGWIEKEAVSHYVDGKDKLSHKMSWRFSAVDEKQFLVRLPPGWRPSACEVNGTNSEVLSTNSPGEYRITVPLRQLSDISLRCTSRIAPSPWLQQAQFTKPKLPYPVLVSEHSIHVPPTLVALVLDGDSAPQPNFAQVLNPRSWWAYLSPAVYPKSTKFRKNDWTIVRLPRVAFSSTDYSQADSKVISVVLAERTALAGLAIAGCLLATSLIYLLIGYSVIRSMVILIALTVLVLMMPLPFAAAGQVVLLAGVLAAGLRLVGFVTARKPQDNSQSRAPSSIASNVPTLTIAIACLLLPGLASGRRLLAQSQLPSETPKLESTDTGTGNEKSRIPETFGILVPVDARDNVAGSYAYVPQRLYDLLFDGQLQETSQSEPRILKADYTLRVNPTTIADGELVQELSAQFTVSMPRRDQQLELPIRMDQMPLLRSEVNGRANAFGVSVGQTLLSPDKLVFTAVEAGEYQLSLYFAPTALLKLDGAAELKAEIPPIPSANLRIFHDGNTRVEVKAKGSIQRLGNQLQVALGGQAEIDCRWFSRPSNASSGGPINTTSHVWLEAKGGRLSAASVLEVENPFALPDTFRIVLNESWQAIGTDWGDAEIISTSLSPLSGRRIYVARWKSSLNRSMTKAVVRAALGPRVSNVKPSTSDRSLVENAAGLSIGSSSRQVPFLVLQEAQQVVDRTLTWSSSQDSKWQTEVRNKWIALGRPSEAQAQQRWGSFVPPTDARSYRAPVGVTGATVSKIQEDREQVVSEITQVHLAEGEARIDYSAQWLRSRVEGKPLVFLVPPNARVASVLIDGVECAYQVTSDADAKSLVVQAPSSRSEVKRAELELTYPISTSKRQPLMRIVAKDTRASSSVIRVLRASSLQCDLTPDPPGTLFFEAVSARPTEMLENLERLVGQVELGNQFRESCQLPVSVTLRPAPTPDNVDSAIFVQRIQDSWKALLTVRVQGDHQPDFLFFDLPQTLRDELEVGQVPLRFIPSADSDRITLAVMPLSTEQRITEFEMQFPIRTASAGKQLIIPHMSMLSGESLIPRLALPTSVDGEPAKWRTGREVLPDNEAYQQGLPRDFKDRSYEFFEGSQRATQVTWETESELQPMPALLLSKTTLGTVEGDSAVGYFDFWVDPLGNTELEFEIPETLQVIGASVGDQIARMRRNGHQKISVLLEPNYAPVFVRVLTIWRLDSSSRLPLLRPRASRHTLLADAALPGISASVSEAIAEVELNNQSVYVLDSHGQTEGVFDQQDVGTVQTTTFAALWYQVVRRSLDSLKGQPVPQAVGWLKGWHPATLGLPLSTPLSSPDQQETEVDEATVGQAWQEFCDELDLELAAPESVPILADVENPESRATDNLHSELPIFSGNLLRRQTVGRKSLSPRFIVATLAILIGFLFLIAYKLLYKRMQTTSSNQVWASWLVLTAITWFFLPVYWPSIIVAILALLVISSRALDRNRRLQLR